MPSVDYLSFYWYWLKKWQFLARETLTHCTIASPQSWLVPWYWSPFYCPSFPSSPSFCTIILTSFRLCLPFYKHPHTGLKIGKQREAQNMSNNARHAPFFSLAFLAKQATQSESKRNGLFWISKKGWNTRLWEPEFLLHKPSLSREWSTRKLERNVLKTQPFLESSPAVIALSHSPCNLPPSVEIAILVTSGYC